MLRNHIRDQEEYIYVATTTKYQKNNLYKIGRTIDLNRRLVSYNTGRADDDNMFYCLVRRCANVRGKEKYLLKLLNNFRTNKRKEMLKINYEALDKVINEVVKD